MTDRFQRGLYRILYVMGMDDGPFKRTLGALGLGALVTTMVLPAKVDAHPISSIAKKAEDPVQKTGLKVESHEGSEIERLREVHDLNLRGYLRERSGLDISQDSKRKSEVFETGRAYGEALRKFKLKYGFPYPNLSASPLTDEFEKEAAGTVLSDTRKQEMFEKYLRQLKEDGEIVEHAEDAVRGQYCGEFPDLCPPEN